jgi:hypothetical protein
MKQERRMARVISSVLDWTGESRRLQPVGGKHNRRQPSSDA